ncbi:gluconolactonase [Haloferula luteola]|uniref:Gluconolactonase n=1 Tax=Haloferula luteola TaxID=595692 RepID=A0A840VDY5_9BACT|nr:SMP-30/gluconolactonase/LRE family protein [Haloferula luteola]MBB5351051.1 gluconolactonase [Haloferula luteola]
MLHRIACVLLISRLAGEPESIERLDPALDRILPVDAAVETLMTGFAWVEGPVWDPRHSRLLFSDIPANTIHAWSAANEHLDIFLKPSGYTGTGDYGREPGANGLALNADGDLLCCEHGDRRLSILKPGGGKLTLADRFEGQRLNSPNDLTLHPNGSIYFTDPPYGLPRGADDPFRELDFCGVYRIDPEGKLQLLTREIERPNGIALNPQGDLLYVSQSSGKEPFIWRFPIENDGSLGPRRMFFDARTLEGPGAPDGLKVAEDGTVFATGPGGLLILSPTGKLLGRILCHRPTANVALAPGELYLTSSDRILRVPRIMPR